MGDRRSAVEQFSPLAAEYARFSYHAAGPDLLPMLEAAELSGGERVLDLGCGPGHTALLFAAKARQVVGIDPTGSMLDEARRLAAERGLTNVSFELAGAEELPFPDASFERITSRQSAHHWPDIAAAMREVKRVLAPDGRVVLIDTVAPEEEIFDRFLSRIELLRDPSHVRDYRVSEWHRFFAAAGLTLERIADWSIALNFEDWVRRSRTAPAAVGELRQLMSGAAAPIRRRFAISPGCDWEVPVSLLAGRPR